MISAGFLSYLSLPPRAVSHGDATEEGVRVYAGKSVRVSVRDGGGGGGGGALSPSVSLSAAPQEPDPASPSSDGRTDGRTVTMSRGGRLCAGSSGGCGDAASSAEDPGETQPRRRNAF